MHRALLNLDASDNLLSFTMYERLGLEELKPTKMILQLANHSTRLPGEMVKDVLTKVEKFIFPVDFIVLETKAAMSTKSQILVILGWPLLATSNVLINCKDQKLKSTF